MTNIGNLLLQAAVDLKILPEETLFVKELLTADRFIQKPSLEEGILLKRRVDRGLKRTRSASSRSAGVRPTIMRQAIIALVKGS